MSNMYKHSPLPKWVKSRVLQRSNKKPVNSYKTQNYKFQEDLNILDVYKFHARQQTAAEDPNVAKWKGGDFEDRKEYIQKKKKEMGPNLERVLGLSSKRTTHSHTVKEDMAAIEFDGVFR